MILKGEYEILDLSRTVEWHNYLAKLSPDKQDIYYTPEYYQLYQDLGDGTARCFVFKRGESVALYPFLINSVNELGFKLDGSYFDIQGAYGYNGVITNDCSNEFIYNFYEVFKEYIQNENIICEFTRFHPLIGNHILSLNNLNICFDRKVIFLDLNREYNELFSKFQTTTRKQIKRAVNRYSLEIKILENDNLILEDFFQIYTETMRRVDSTPYLFFNKSYFKSLIEKTKNVCFMAYHHDMPIACIIAFHNGYYLDGHLGGSLTDYMYMSPISLLYNEMIKYGKSKELKYLNIGGGASKDAADPLFEFKTNFSKSTADFFIGKAIYNQKIYDEVISQWEVLYPLKKNVYANMLLKYRY